MTRRTDLDILTVDDLVTLTNRGVVKRATQEVDRSDLSFEIAEDEHAVAFHWSDGVDCVFPAGLHVRDAKCTCAATTLCRHLVRSVLAYQATASDDGAPAVARDVVWDPGDIEDSAIEAHFKSQVLRRLRAQFEEGHVIELVRGAKPVAYIHTLSCQVRFLVPGDIRYTHCDCAEVSPCGHVPLAIWAFRSLEEGVGAGLLSTGSDCLEVPHAWLDTVERTMADVCIEGIASTPSPIVDRMRRLESDARERGIVWPAQVLAELVQELERYARHDARFSPDSVANLVGSLLARVDAIRNAPASVPPLFVRGSVTERQVDVGSTRLVGLGCGVREEKKGVEIFAYLQDTDSGAVVAVTRYVADPMDGERQSFARLAQTPVKGMPLVAISGGQLLTRGGKRSIDRRFTPGKAQLNPQAWQWEKLREPVLSPGIDELRMRLAALPPKSLRPRRVGDDLHVIPVRKVNGCVFSTKDQNVHATIIDESGAEATLVHPYTTRGASGTEAMLSALRNEEEALRFVSGHVRVAGDRLVIAPVGLVFEKSGVRRMIQPWVEAPASSLVADQVNGRGEAPRLDSVAEVLERLTAALGETMLLGVRNCNLGQWREVERDFEAVGLVRLARPITRLTATLEKRDSSIAWDGRDACSRLFELAVIADIARETATGAAQG